MKLDIIHLKRHKSRCTSFLENRRNHNTSAEKWRHMKISFKINSTYLFNVNQAIPNWSIGGGYYVYFESWKHYWCQMQTGIFLLIYIFILGECWSYVSLQTRTRSVFYETITTCLIHFEIRPTSQWDWLTLLNCTSSTSHRVLNII